MAVEGIRGRLDAAVPVVAVGVVWLLRETRWFRVLTGEDALLEWAQVGAFAVAAWCLVHAAMRVDGRPRRAYALAALVVGVAIGEELAWGTRLLDVDVSLAGNDQGEATVHNIGQALDLSFLAISGVAVALTAFVLVARRRGAPAPPIALAVWFAVPAAYAALRVVDGDPGYALAKLSEATELLLAVGMARVARLELRRTDQPVTTVAASATRWSSPHGGPNAARGPWSAASARPPSTPTA